MGCIFGVVGPEVEDYKDFPGVMSESLFYRHHGHMKTYQDHDVLLVAGGNADCALVMSQDDSIIAVCEGEIYNGEMLSAHFPEVDYSPGYGNGFSFVPLLYEKYGNDFPKYLNGIFTIALWDKRENILYLVRDHVGSHSLFYSVLKDSIFFSTTIRSLCASGHVIPRLSSMAINQFFASRALSPPSTMFENIAAIRAAHVTKVKDTGAIEYDYWKLGDIDIDHVNSSAFHIQQMQSIIYDSIQIRAHDQGFYGAIVSGGLDTSAVIATLMKDCFYSNLETFSVSFEEKAFTDASLQQIMIDFFHLKHHQAVITSSEFVELLTRGISYFDSPVNDVAYVGMSKVFQLVSNQGVGAVLEGEGPDELFPSGNTHGEREIYPFLVIPPWIRHKLIGLFFRNMPLGNSFFDKMARFLTRVGMDDEERRVTWRTYFHDHSRKCLLNLPFYKNTNPYNVQIQYLKETKETDFFNKYQYGLIKSFLPDDLLYKNERMASSYGVINRTPLIDYRLVELALKIPSLYQLKKPDKNSDGIKLLYKKAIKDLIPDEILYRKKMRGFSHPTQEWYRHQLREFVYDTLLSKKSKERGILNIKYVQKLLDDHSSGRSNLDFPISSMLIFELWMREYCDKL